MECSLPRLRVTNTNTCFCYTLLNRYFIEHCCSLSWSKGICERGLLSYYFYQWTLELVLCLQYLCVNYFSSVHKNNCIQFLRVNYSSSSHKKVTASLLLSLFNFRREVQCQPWTKEWLHGCFCWFQCVCDKYYPLLWASRSGICAIYSFSLRWVARKCHLQTAQDVVCINVLLRRVWL